MPSYKLIYFNARGAAETSRMLLTLADQQFDDVRVSREEWATMKEDQPFGQLPVLEVDGVKICDSRSIERFVAKRYGLYGSSDMDQAKSDMVMGCLDDLSRPFREIYMAPDDKKDELRRKYLSEKGPDYLRYLSKFVSEGGLIHGDQITWPDVAIFNMLNLPTSLIDLSALVENEPKLKQLKKIVGDNAKISAWIAKRPHTEM